MAVSLWPSCKVPLLACLPSNSHSFSCYPRSLDLSRRHQLKSRQAINGKFKLKEAPLFSRPVSSYHLKPVFAHNTDHPHPSVEELVSLKRSESFEQWDSVTAKFCGAANLPFLLLQLPQIILNARNLMGGNKLALLAVPWLGMLTGLLGNLSLLSYFIKKRETGAVVVQALGVISTYAVISQLALAEAMPVSYFIGISTVVASGLFLNFMKYFDLLKSEIWLFWEEFTTIGGLSVLPQVMWSTFIPYVPNSILPGMISFVAAILAVLMARMGKLPEKGVKILGSLSGWTATLLFMWMPVAQMWTNILNPDNIKGLSAITMLLAMIGNGLLLPRALFIRDLMWFTGSYWGCAFYGWGNLLCLYRLHCTTREFFLAATLAFFAWIGVSDNHVPSRFKLIPCMLEDILSGKIHKSMDFVPHSHLLRSSFSVLDLDLPVSVVIPKSFFQLHQDSKLTVRSRSRLRMVLMLTCSHHHVISSYAVNEPIHSQ